jgi:Uma2 family endonuclease
MATILENSTSNAGRFALIQPGERLFTVADVAAMPRDLPSRSVSFEPYHGRLVPMSPPGAVHGNLQSRFGAELMMQGEKKGHGKTYTEVGILFARQPDHLIGADAAFVMSRSLPPRIAAEGYLESVSELIVEIRSKNDKKSRIDAKVADYLHFGAKHVWVVSESPETVVEYRSGAKPKKYGRNDALTCDDVIPGFRLALADLFRE